MSSWPQANIYARFLSALHNGVRGFFFFLVFYFPIRLFSIMEAKHNISNVANISDINSIARSVNYSNEEAVLSIAVLIVLYGLVIRPIKNDLTWGQEACNLRIIDKNGREVNGSIQVILLRILGHFLTLASCGILFLIPFFRKDKKTIADILSSSGQIVDPKIEPDTGVKTFFSTLGLYIIFLVFNYGMIHWLNSSIESQIVSLSPTVQKQQPEARERAGEAYKQAAWQRHLIRLEKKCENGDTDACEVLTHELGPKRRGKPIQR